MTSPRCRLGTLLAVGLMVLASCSGNDTASDIESGADVTVDTAQVDEPTTPEVSAVVDEAGSGVASSDVRFSSRGGTWNWYLQGDTPPAGDYELIDLDLFETTAEQVAALQQSGVLVICYLSAGTVEDWREDAGDFDASIVGAPWPEWEGESYLDISALDVIGPPLEARLDLCAEKGFDGVEADNVDAYGAETGFELTPQHGADFVRWLAEQSHERGLGFGLKNVSDLISEVGDVIDFAITEDCYADGWCDEMLPLTANGIAVYAAEYTDALGELTPTVCDHALTNGISVALFDRSLDGSSYAVCAGGGSRSDESSAGGGSRSDVSSPGWVKSNPGGGGAYSTVAISADGATILAGSDLSGVSRSVDGGANWTVVGARDGLTDTHIASIGFDRFDPDRVFVGTDGGLWVSTNGGASFERTDVNGYVSAITAVGDRIYVSPQPEYNTNNASILRSDNAAGTFSPTAALPDGLYVLAIRVSENDPDHVVVLTGPGRFADSPKRAYESLDGGGSWSLVIGRDDVLDAQFDPSDASSIWLAVDDYDEDSSVGDGQLLLVSSEGSTIAAERSGILWITSDTAGSVRTIDPRVQYPWDDRNGTWSIDETSGVSEQIGQVDNWSKGWSKVYFAYGDSFNGIVPTIGFDPSNSQRALWVNAQWVYETLDGGQTFHPIFTDEVGDDQWRSRGFDNVVVEDIAVSSDEQTIYIGFWDLGCFVSPDGGESWQSCNTTDYSGDWDGYGGFTGTVLADPTRPDVAWSSHAQDWAAPASLLRTTEGGAPGTWQPTTGLPVLPQVLGLSVDATSAAASRTLYVTADGDVYRSQDDGLNWVLDLACGGCRTTTVGVDGTTFAGGEAGLFRRSSAGWEQVGATFAGEVSGPPWDYAWTGVVEVQSSGDTVWAAVFDTGVFRSADLGDTWELVLDDPFVRTVSLDSDNETVWVGTSSAYQAGGYDPASRGLLKTTDGGETWVDEPIDLAWPFVTDISVGSGGLVVLASPGEGLFFNRLR